MRSVLLLTLTLLFIAGCGRTTLPQEQQEVAPPASVSVAPPRSDQRTPEAPREEAAVPPPVPVPVEAAKPPPPPPPLRPNPPARPLLTRRLKAEQAVVWYLYHSGVAVKTQRHLLLLDYSNDEPATPGKRSLATGVVEPTELAEQNVLVFISHEHDDHFWPDCLKWREAVKKIRYVVAPEVAKADVRFAAQPGRIDVLPPDTHRQIEGFKVSTLRSTDSGVAFLVEGEGLVLYHSGDLGCWNWSSDPNAEKQFVDRNLAPLKGKRIDLAFHVADPRLRDQGWSGFLAFAAAFRPRLLVPLHLRGDHAACGALSAALKERGFAGTFWTLRQRGEARLYNRGRVSVL